MADGVLGDRATHRYKSLIAGARPAMLAAKAIGESTPATSVPDSEVRIIVLHIRLRTSESKDTSNLLN